MFQKVLIANRGEISCRISRTLKRLGIKSVAIFSEADAGSRHVKAADEAFLVGPPHVTESYLNIDRILEVAKSAGCDAVHPGYGLLSENSEFVGRVRDAGMTFIGPTEEVMQLMGDKAAARAFAIKAGVPVVPGTRGEIEGEDAAVEFAETFGYPLLVKAAAGGGGIGMKLARKEKQLRKAVQECVRRGESSFGSGRIYLERYVEDPRHIEIQVFGDNRGNVIHLLERECSVQRRHQKVIEEAPSLMMTRFPGLREKMTEAAVALAKQANYTNAGTVEFIVSPDGEFYFIEMNTRLQVEHPVTEGITGLDLVELQLRVAAGEPLGISQEEVHLNGHAIECRIYAESPEKMFLPQPGRIEGYVEPEGEGIRVDSGVQSNWDVTSFYDPLVSKLVTHGKDRDQARERMKSALSAYQIEGLTHNIQMHLKVLDSDAFVNGDVHTSWLEEWMKESAEG